jgi:hypothetical protein
MSLLSVTIDCGCDTEISPYSDLFRTCLILSSSSHVTHFHRSRWWSRITVVMANAHNQRASPIWSESELYVKTRLNLLDNSPSLRSVSWQIALLTPRCQNFYKNPFFSLVQHRCAMRGQNTQQLEISKKDYPRLNQDQSALSWLNSS